MIARAELARSLPGLLAALLLALLPACATGRPVQEGPITDPHITTRVAPRDAEAPAGIQRGAGGSHPDAEAQKKAEAEAYGAAYIVLAILSVGLLVLLFSCLGGLYDVIRDALNTPAELDD